MSKLIVSGGRSLNGEVRVHGSKNAALPILTATLLVEEPVRLTNCPRLKDVDNMLSILEALGCRYSWEGDTLTVDAGSAAGYELPEQLSKELRSSIFLLGSVLARFSKARATYPGGCEIGIRPIDLHLAGLKQLGVKVREEGGYIHCSSERLVGATVCLDYPSVGATENIMLAATHAEGETTIENAAKEPEIGDLQGFLNACGFRVRGAGSSTIVITGGGKGRGAQYRIMPDRIVAGTLLTAGAIAGGQISVTDAPREQLVSVLEKLRQAGCDIREEAQRVTLTAPLRPRELPRVDTMPYPGFPTDMQAQLFALCSVAEGTSCIAENVFENRFKHAQELRRLGGRNTIHGRTAIVYGVPRLTGATVTAHDLRGGAALLLAGLKAEGETVVERAELIDRGYLDPVGLLGALGASLRRTED